MRVVSPHELPVEDVWPYMPRSAAPWFRFPANAAGTVRIACECAHFRARAKPRFPIRMVGTASPDISRSHCRVVIGWV